MIVINTTQEKNKHYIGQFVTVLEQNVCDANGVLCHIVRTQDKECYYMVIENLKMVADNVILFKKREV
jgi:hypothetical protein